MKSSPSSDQVLYILRVSVCNTYITAKLSLNAQCYSETSLVRTSKIWVPSSTRQISRVILLIYFLGEGVVMGVVLPAIVFPKYFLVMDISILQSV